MSKRLDESPKKRIGRPPLPPEQRAEPATPRTIRLTNAEWAELQTRGVVEWLRPLLREPRAGA